MPPSKNLAILNGSLTSTNYLPTTNVDIILCCSTHLILKFLFTIDGCGYLWHWWENSLAKPVTSSTL